MVRILRLVAVINFYWLCSFLSGLLSTPATCTILAFAQSVIPSKVAHWLSHSNWQHVINATQREGSGSGRSFALFLPIRKWIGFNWSLSSFNATGWVASCSGSIKAATNCVMYGGLFEARFKSRCCQTPAGQGRGPNTKPEIVAKRMSSENRKSNWLWLWHVVPYDKGICVPEGRGVLRAWHVTRRHTHTHTHIHRQRIAYSVVTWHFHHSRKSRRNRREACRVRVPHVIMYIETGRRSRGREWEEGGVEAGFFGFGFAYAGFHTDYTNVS